MHHMIQETRRKHRHVGQKEHGRNMEGSVEQIIRKDNKHNKNNRAGSRDFHKIQAKFWKLWKYQDGSRSPRKHWEGL